MLSSVVSMFSKMLVRSSLHAVPVGKFYRLMWSSIFLPDGQGGVDNGLVRQVQPAPNKPVKFREVMKLVETMETTPVIIPCNHPWNERMESICGIIGGKCGSRAMVNY